MTGYLHAVEFRRGEGWDDEVYPFNLPVLRDLDALRLHPKCTFLIGENGSGKSTLVEAIAVALRFNPEGGSKNFNFKTRASHSSLTNFVRPIRSLLKPIDGYFLRAESYFNVATEIERLDEDPLGGPPLIDSYGGRSLHEQSHGESVFALLQHRFRGDGLYILDEPEAGLSPTRQLSVLTRLHDLIRARSQFIIATHSPIVLAYPDAWIYRCGEEGLERVEYADAEPVEISRAFLNRRERFLYDLLAPDPDEPKPR